MSLLVRPGSSGRNRILAASLRIRRTRVGRQVMAGHSNGYSLISDHPEIGNKSARTRDVVRRFPLHHFPLFLIYRQRADHLQTVAWHIQAGDQIRLPLNEPHGFLDLLPISIKTNQDRIEPFTPLAVSNSARVRPPFAVRLTTLPIGCKPARHANATGGSRLPRTPQDRETRSANGAIAIAGWLHP